MPPSNLPAVSSRRYPLLPTLALATTCAAVTHGSAVAPAPERPAELTLLWHNDVFGGEVGTNPDDFRTNGFSVGLRIGRDWLLATDWSNMTNRGGVRGPFARVDELTSTLSRILLDHVDGDHQMLFAVGAGLQFSGDLGGEGLQNRWHELFSFLDVELPYEDHSSTGLLTCSWHMQLGGFRPWPEAEVVLARGTHPLLVNDGAMLISEDFVVADISTRMVLGGADGSFWFGVRNSIRSGEAQSETAAATWIFERGNWLIFGATAGNLVAELSIDTRNELSTGWLGWRSGYDRQPERYGGDRLIAEVGAVLGDFAITAVCRWQPDWLAGAGPLGRRSSILTNYSYGHVPEVELEGASIRYQQFTIGLDHAWFEPTGSFQVTPFVSSAMGYRQEEITPEQELIAIRREKETALVLEVALGARAIWGELPQAAGTRFGLSASYNYRFVSNSASARDGNGTKADFLADNGDFQLRLICEMGW